MEEVGIDMSVHTPHILDELVANHFDLVITLSDDAPDAVARKGLEARAVEHWQVEDPSLVEGNRELVLGAYRDLRNSLRRRVRDRLEPLVSGGSQN
jgi:protein-tyrosine-phosphatase